MRLSAGQRKDSELGAELWQRMRDEIGDLDVIDQTAIATSFVTGIKRDREWADLPDLLRDVLTAVAAER